MKIAGMGRRNRPHCIVLQKMQLYSTRGWVYREGQGWVFAELTPDERAEFKSYRCDITIPRMRIRLPYSQVIGFIQIEQDNSDDFANWFAHCTMPQPHPLVLSRFQCHQITDDKPIRYTRYSIRPGSHKTWLWADEVKFCRELGCEVSVHGGYGRYEWGVPVEWKLPLQYKEHVFIYAIVDELTQEVYVGQTDNLERRWTEHLKNTKNTGKAALIQSLYEQGQEPKLIKLEEVVGEKAAEQERYWISYYKNQGYKIINRDYMSLV